jgi:hypothetical protein
VLKVDTAITGEMLYPLFRRYGKKKRYIRNGKKD